MTEQTRPETKTKIENLKPAVISYFVEDEAAAYGLGFDDCKSQVLKVFSECGSLTAEPATGEGAKAEFREWLYSELPGTSIFKDAAIADKAAEIFAGVREATIAEHYAAQGIELAERGDDDKGPDYIAGLKQMIARQDAEIAKLNRDMEREERDHLGTIDHRDQHEERINAIVRELGLGEYESSWTSHNDPSERAIEEINSLQQNSLKWREWAVKELSDVANALEEDDDNELRRKLSVVLAELAEEATPHPAIIEGRGQAVTKEQEGVYAYRWPRDRGFPDPDCVKACVFRDGMIFSEGTEFLRMGDIPTFPPRPTFTAPPKPEQTIELTLQAPIGSAVHWKTLGGKEHVGKLIEWDSNVAIVKTEQGVKAVEC